jgi:hypothetical protein
MENNNKNLSSVSLLDDLRDQALACGFVDSMTGAAPELEVPRGV